MKDSYFIGLLTIILFITVLFSAFLGRIFPPPDIELETFDFSKHNKLVFDDAFRGSNPDSNLTVAFFMDFKCPACIEQYPAIKRLMINHSDVNFLYKHLVYSSDEDGKIAAIAFECAKMQDKGYTLADYLFTHQFTAKDLFAYLDIIEINRQQFDDCFNSTLIRNLVEADAMHAQYLEIRGSPTMFINGIKVEGVHSYEVLDQLIREEKKNKTFIENE